MDASEKIALGALVAVAEVIEETCEESDDGLCPLTPLYSALRYVEGDSSDWSEIVGALHLAGRIQLTKPWTDKGKPPPLGAATHVRWVSGNRRTRVVAN